MKLLSDLVLDDLNAALASIDGRIRRLEGEGGTLGVPTAAPRAPTGREARLYFDMTEGKIVVVTRDDIHEWSED